MMFFLSLVLIVKLHLHSAQPVPTETYANHLVLTQPDAYHLFWNYNDTDIVFEVHVKQTGVNWIGFGLSKNGGMQNSVKYYLLIFTLLTQYYAPCNNRNNSVIPQSLDRDELPKKLYFEFFSQIFTGFRTRVQIPKNWVFSLKFRN